jgi:hypothetical protein
LSARAWSGYRDRAVWPPKKSQFKLKNSIFPYFAPADGASMCRVSEVREDGQIEVLNRYDNKIETSWTDPRLACIDAFNA